MRRKVLGHRKVYHDSDTGHTFYAKLSNLADISVLVLDKDLTTVRQYMVDFASLVAMQNMLDDKPITVIDRFLMIKGAKPSVIKNYEEKDEMTLIRTVDSKFVKSAVVAKITPFADSKAIYFKRIAWNAANKSILGIDTLALPLKGVEAFMKHMKKLFKGVNLDLELTEVEDGSN